MKFKVGDRVKTNMDGTYLERDNQLATIVKVFNKDTYYIEYDNEVGTRLYDCPEKKEGNYYDCIGNIHAKLEIPNTKLGRKLNPDVKISKDKKWLYL